MPFVATCPKKRPGTRFAEGGDPVFSVQRASEMRLGYVVCMIQGQVCNILPTWDSRHGAQQK